MRRYPPIETGIAHVPTEDDLPNEAKALPTQRGTILLLTFVASAMAILGMVLSFSLEWELAGLLLCLLGLVLAIVASIMGYGDARGSFITPVMASIGAGVLALVVIFDVADTGETLQRVDPTAALLGTEPATESTDAERESEAQTASGTIAAD